MGARPLRQTLNLLVAVAALVSLCTCAGSTKEEAPGQNSAAPTITSQPSSQTVTANQTATFTVAATGNPAPTYQWQNAATGANIPGATSASYMTPATTPGDNGSKFRVVVSNSAGSMTSSTVSLTVDYAPSITAQPTNQTVLVNQMATFSVTATGNPPPTYQWQNAATSANIPGATSASYTTPPTLMADNGSTFQVVVTNSVGSQTSLPATLTVNANGPPPTNASVLTYHNDNMRTGLNPNETILTATNVNSTAFGRLGALSVTGLVDAEPLYVPNLTINGAAHNVVFVVTEHDMAYAFDADTPGPALWQVSLIPGTETPSDDRGCGQVEPEIGITSTPVIDTSAGPNGTMFAVTMSKDSSNNYHQRLHAVDLTTGADRITPTLIQATYPGNGSGSSNGTQTFNPGSYEERAALLLTGGVIYTTWTSHCDAPNYTSWVIGYNESTLAQASVLNMTANGNTQGGREGGIWNAGDGPSVDASGNIYFLIGNGTFDTTLDGNGFPNTHDFGNSFVKLSASGGALSVADYFAMDIARATSSGQLARTRLQVNPNGFCQRSAASIEFFGDILLLEPPRKSRATRSNSEEYGVQAAFWSARRPTMHGDHRRYAGRGPRFGKWGKQSCTDTGPPDQEDEITRGRGVSRRDARLHRPREPGQKPFFAWFNSPACTSGPLPSRVPRKNRSRPLSGRHGGAYAQVASF